MTPTFHDARRALTGLATTLLMTSTMLLAGTGAAVAATTGSGKTATESRTVGDFTAIAGSASIDIDVRQGSPTSVQVSADDNLLPLLETVVEPGRSGAVLHVRWKRGESIRTKSKTLVTVVVPQLLAVSGSGSGDIQVQGFAVPSFTLSMSGSGDARLSEMKAGELQVSVSGSSDVVASGSAGKVQVSIAGSGDIKFAQLRADDVQVRIAGSGDAEVHADKQLSVSIAGSGDVRYSGEASVSSKIAGSGTVRKK